ncbi:Hypothetical predicted protein [Olea europaea subsp. europaea]|uniref:Uncharacterized protein n=1 Tax=Olea europaea subsp. europaea TaxID=158383 RepID=A0A8S0TKN0_OLEEU|nr:Hypothetical predicted protein [Olea europaea subsp. europaea]
MSPRKVQLAARRRRRRERARRWRNFRRAAASGRVTPNGPLPPDGTAYQARGGSRNKQFAALGLARESRGKAERDPTCHLRGRATGKLQRICAGAFDKIETKPPRRLCLSSSLPCSLARDRARQFARSLALVGRTERFELSPLFPTSVSRQPASQPAGQTRPLVDLGHLASVRVRFRRGPHQPPAPVLAKWHPSSRGSLGEFLSTNLFDSLMTSRGRLGTRGGTHTSIHLLRRPMIYLCKLSGSPCAAPKQEHEFARAALNQQANLRSRGRSFIGLVSVVVGRRECGF